MHRPVREELAFTPNERDCLDLLPLAIAERLRNVLSVIGSFEQELWTVKLVRRCSHVHCWPEDYLPYQEILRVGGSSCTAGIRLAGSEVGFFITVMRDLLQSNLLVGETNSERLRLISAALGFDTTKNPQKVVSINGPSDSLSKSRSYRWLAVLADSVDCSDLARHNMPPP